MKSDKGNLAAAQKKRPAEHKATVAPRYPRHMMGKMCGYQLYEDGSIQIAPTHYEQIENARQQREALDLLLAAMTKQCHQLGIPIAAMEKRFWQGVTDDYGLDFSAYDYSYSFDNHRILRKPKPKSSTEPGGGQDSAEEK